MKSPPSSNENLGFNWTDQEPVQSDLTLPDQLSQFTEFGKATRQDETRAITFKGDPISVPTFINEFWTSKQRAASSLHEVSYGCDINPLGTYLTQPRLDPPTIAEVEARVRAVDFTDVTEMPEPLQVFYHPDTRTEIVLSRTGRGDGWR